jgi:molecular chaperone DnaJ
MANTNYYQTLEVSKTATADEIKKAYRRLSRKYHPDMNPDDKQSEAKFKEIQQAFDILGDEEKRRQYDQFGEAFGRRGPQGDAQTWTSGQPGFDFQDLFGKQFGGRSG